MNEIRIENLTKSYDGKTNVIENFNLTIDEGEFLVLLGPSGCGKSTLLRLIAGLEEMQGGSISIGDKCINDTLPKDRDIAMVFQNYALYPHMTVYKNIAISLILKKRPADEIKERVDAVAEMLSIGDLLDRKPSQLSGGQMQRVALARAMIRNPKAFLMDEPLSNLDAKLRVQTRGEIIKLHNKLGITTIYVTHDQIEAMTMASRIVLMNRGEIMQAGTPDELYNRPKNIFTAAFIGSPQMNLFDGIVKDKKASILNQSVPLELGDMPIVIGLRSEDIRIVEGDDFQVLIIENLGSEKLITLKYLANGTEIVAKVPTDVDCELDDKVGIDYSREKLHIFSEETKQRLLD